MSTLLCIGMGYVARALAGRLSERGWRVIGSSRSAEGVAAIDASGFEGVGFDDGALDRAAREATHLLHSAPPSEAGDPVLARLGEPLGFSWIGYLGTTAVYGDTGGAWVGEEDALRPSVERAKRRERAEALWRERGAQAFRLAGIYGPGRNAFRQLRAGKARRIVKEGQVFSRVHRDDIVAVLEASIARPNPGRVYNVADDLPAPPGDVIAFAAELLGIAPPPEVPFEKAELSAMARTFYRDCRRVRNGRIKEELEIELLYPTYREGLTALLEEDGA